MKTICVKLEDALAEKLAAVAHDKRTTVSAIVRELVESYTDLPVEVDDL